MTSKLKGIIIENLRGNAKVTANNISSLEKQANNLNGELKAAKAENVTAALLVAAIEKAENDLTYLATQIEQQYEWLKGYIERGLVEGAAYETAAAPGEKMKIIDKINEVCGDNFKIGNKQVVQVVQDEYVEHEIANDSLVWFKTNRTYKAQGATFPYMIVAQKLNNGTWKIIKG